ncbi:F-box/WD repeat-containing protein 4 [Latimeria chalumnae]|uniref:F-box/WD repeat-containing protein 4 n=1 Tax=Latimeria chalumnae TaxID=7897 RepID=UPI00313BF4E6
MTSLNDCADVRSFARQCKRQRRSRSCTDSGVKRPLPKRRVLANEIRVIPASSLPSPPCDSHVEVCYYNGCRRPQLLLSRRLETPWKSRPAGAPDTAKRAPRLAAAAAAAAGGGGRRRRGKGKPSVEGGKGPPPPEPAAALEMLSLPEDVVFLLLSYLDPRALCRLSQVCRKLRHFVSRDAVWRRLAKNYINTGITQQGADLVPRIPLKERVKISQNWKSGRCRRATLLKWKRNLLPWIQLDRDREVLYLSQAADIRAYQLRANGSSVHRQPVAVYAGHRDDVCRFVLTSSHIISGGGDGRIVLHQAPRYFSAGFLAHNQEVNCIDSRGGVIVSGSRDQTARVWSLLPNRLGQCLHTISTEDRVWSLAISPILSSFVTGTACCGHVSPLRIWDLQSGQLVTCLGTDFRRGAGVLDVLYETPSTLLSCGYDTYIRYWDVRTSTRKCVLEWEEPHDNALYCIQSDGNHMIASGSSYYGVVRLWDKRHRMCLQEFSLSSPTSSPVYCLRFTTTHLYAVLASALYTLDFTAADTVLRK